MWLPRLASTCLRGKGAPSGPAYMRLPCCRRWGKERTAVPSPITEKSRKFGCGDRVKCEWRKTDGWQQTNCSVPVYPIAVE